MKINLNLFTNLLNNIKPRRLNQRIDLSRSIYNKSEILIFNKAIIRLEQYKSSRYSKELDNTSKNNSIVSVVYDINSFKISLYA